MATKQVIAKVKLNPGKGGYFDPITRIHLTHGDAEKPVFAGMNTTNLRKAVRDKRITITSGSLGEFTPPFKLVKTADGKVVLTQNNGKVNAVKETKKEVPKKTEEKEPVVEEPVIEEPQPAPEPEPVVEEPVAEEPVVEESVEETEEAEEVEAPVEEKPSKKGKKRRGKKSAEDASAE